MLRRVVPISLLVLAFAASAADARSGDVKHAAARLRGCDQAAHTGAFRASMWSLARDNALQMRFALQSRTASQPVWAAGAQPEGFDVWLKANPGVNHYVVDKTVKGLAEGADYRVVVRFRWRDASGAVIGRAVRRTRACRQPDKRPNLVIERISAVSGTEPGTRLYSVRIGNHGASAAAIFQTRLEVNGSPLPEQATKEPLAAGDWTELDFDGPPCESGSSLVATADTGDAGGSVDEADETDNGLTVDCPPLRRNGRGASLD